MKYIRTENHIYLIRKDISYGGNKIYKIYNHNFAIIGNNFKVADTIEELCDEFVYVNKSNNSKTIYAGFVAIQSKISTMTKIAKAIESELYGAIWTNKGLIYVAKMNDKGDLQLL